MIPGQLEYLMSSLPYLSFQHSKELRRKVVTTFQKYAHTPGTNKSLIELLDDEACKFLSPRAAQIFKELDLQTMHRRAFQQSPNKVVAAFARYLFSLKVSLLSTRMEEQAFRELKQETATLAVELEKGTPLEKEIQIMQLQWEKLEELSIGHHFNLESLIIYKLKLMILDRWWSFNEERGFQAFNQAIQE